MKTRSIPASLSFKGQTTEHTTMQWSIPKTKKDHTKNKGKNLEVLPELVICQ